jgi:hypothetical protein
LSSIALTILVVIHQALALGGAPGQEKRARPAPTGLALEITFYQGKAPAYQAVPSPEAKPTGAWYAMFGRVLSWQPPVDALPVKAVNILPRLEGDTVRIAVSVHLGVKFFEKEEMVATYDVRENEAVSTTELTRFGVVPFDIKLVRVKPVAVEPLPVLNGTTSLSVTGVEVVRSTLPSYKVTVQNLSDKAVAALGAEVHVNGRRQISSMRQGEDGARLMGAGATYKFYVAGANSAQMTQGAYAPEQPPNQEIHITMVVFDDGSYEGDPETAASFRGFQAGRKVQVERLVALLQKAWDAPAADDAATLEQLKTQAASLGTNADRAALDALQRDFPALRQHLRMNLEVAESGVKTDFLKEIERFEKSGAQAADGKAFRAWLGEKKARYEKWLSNL